MEKKEKKHILTGGVILIALGVLIFLHNTGLWRFGESWPLLLIVVAATTLIQRVKDLGGWILMAVGIVFLLTGTLKVDMQVLGQYVLPLLLVALGVSMLLKKKKKDGPDP
ncbi:MAG: hypothetical protein HPY65_14475 [Syntrophaceae bacterium]|nr:hypothetical protein [Syntrophaceae bacterium]